MYYVFGRSTKPRRWIDKEPFFEDVSFLTGEKIAEPVAKPLEYTLKRLNPHAEDHAPYMPSTLGTRMPLFRDDLLAALRKCGVDNLDVYDAVITDPGAGSVMTNYKAVNIVGAISAADMGRSVATVHGGAPMMDVEFDELVVDAVKARGALMFRLAEAVATVLVHQRIRDYLEGQFDDLAFHEPGDVAL